MSRKLLSLQTGIASPSALRKGLIALAVTALTMGVVDPTEAQHPSLSGSIGVGVSTTNEGATQGPLIGPGVGGAAATVAADGGLWLSRGVGIGAEFSLGMPFLVEQMEGGVGRCCSALTRDHRLTFLSGVLKVRPTLGLVLLGGLSRAYIATSEVRVYTPIGGSPQAPLERDFSRALGAWVVGAEGEIPVSGRLRLVPAARWFQNFPRDDYGLEDPLALGNTTIRVTVSLRGTGAR
jgi:hypothetical protein